MKKNLLSILILALLIVNLAMTGFMMMSVMTTNSQTAKVIADIAAALELEANGGETGGFTGSATAPGIGNLATFGFTGDDKLTITLKPGADNKSHFMVVEVVFSMNTASGDYATYGTSESLDSMRELIKSKINDVLSSYTLEELQADTTLPREQILEQVQELYGSNFIYEVTFSSMLFQ